jgi:hypothetical protein
VGEDEVSEEDIGADDDDDGWVGKRTCLVSKAMRTRTSSRGYVNATETKPGIEVRHPPASEGDGGARLI